MINWLLSRLQRPERGWDPIPPGHAQAYADLQWQSVDESILDRIEEWTGPLARLQVLDLGGGPGHYSAAFARRGAQVTWYDISRTYETIARERTAASGVDGSIRFAVGYLDEAPAQLGRTFDLVFNRICWNYGRSDGGFARAVYALVRPGGYAYVDANTSNFNVEQLSSVARLRTWLNSATGIKVGHPMPPRGRTARLLLRQPVERALVDYSSPYNDCILLQRPALT